MASARRTLVVLALAVLGCQGDGAGSHSACNEQSCSGHGVCLVTSQGQPICECHAGY